MQRRFRRTCPVCGRPDLKNISTHLYKFTAYLLRRENPILSKPRCRHGSPASKGPRHKFSLLVVGPTHSGKTYFVQQILENNRIVYEEQKSIRIFWYYNQWQECYEKLKKSLGKSIRFERGVPKLSEDLCEINARYNNIIILDDLMAEATDSPVVSRLFTQGRHRNASVILSLQNMFPKGK